MQNNQSCYYSSPALNSARWNSDVPTLPPGFLSNPNMSFYSCSSSPEVQIPPPSQCRFLRRCSTTGRFHVFVRAAGSDPTLLLKLVLCVGSGDTQAAALSLFCHMSAESTVNHQKLSVCWRASFLLLTWVMHDLSTLL